MLYSVVYAVRQPEQQVHHPHDQPPGHNLPKLNQLEDEAGVCVECTGVPGPGST